GLELFHRVGRRAVLSSAGEAFLEPARQVLRDLGVLRTSVAAVGGLTAGTLDLVALPTLAVDPLATLVGALRHAHPDVVVRVDQPEDAAAVATRVRSGRSEIGLTALPGAAVAAVGAIDRAHLARRARVAGRERIHRSRHPGQSSSSGSGSPSCEMTSCHELLSAIPRSSSTAMARSRSLSRPAPWTARTTPPMTTMTRPAWYTPARTRFRVRARHARNVNGLESAKTPTATPISARPIRRDDVPASARSATNSTVTNA